MVKLYGLFFGFLIGLSPLFAVPAPAFASGYFTEGVIITEVNWAGSSASTADEWLELSNLGTTAVNLNGYVLSGAATGGNGISIAEDLYLEVGATMLIANYPDSDPKTTLAIAPALVSASISLSNTGLALYLINPTGLIIDQFVASITPAGSSNPYTSAERDLVTGTWFTAVTSENLTNLTQAGTPGKISSLNLPIAFSQDPITIPEPTLSEPTLGVTPVFSSLEISLELFSPIATPIVPEVMITSEQCVCPEPFIAPPVIITPVVTPVITPVVTPVTIPAVAPALTPVVTPIVAPILAPIGLPAPLIIPAKLSLSELYPNPLIGDEWIEIYNHEPYSVSLTGWSVTDATLKATALTGSIPALGYFLINSPIGKLNNDFDTISLINPTGQVVEVISYGNPTLATPDKGETISLQTSGSWSVTAPTPGLINQAIIAIIQPIYDNDNLPYQSTGEIPTLETNSALEPATTISEEFPQFASDGDGSITPPESITIVDHFVSSYSSLGKSVKQLLPKSTATIATKSGKSTKKSTTLTGVITAGPNLFGKQVIMIQGTEIYLHDASWPTGLSTGQTIRVTCEPYQISTGPRCKLAQNTNIIITNQTILESPIALLNAVSIGEFGTLHQLSGIAVDQTNNSLWVELAPGEKIEVMSNAKSGANFRGVKAGDQIKILAVVRLVNGINTLSLRQSSDLQVIADPSASGTALATTNPNSGPSPIVSGGLITGALGTLGTLYARSKKHLSQLFLNIT